jgi:hypothetical protein
MNFSEMLDQLNQRGCARRTSWPMKDGYIVRMMGFNTVWKVLTVPAPNAGNYLFTTDDFAANDWVLIDHYSAEEEETNVVHVVQ